MPPRKLARIEPTDDWPYLQLQFEWPEQEAYEVIRPKPRQMSGYAGVQSGHAAESGCIIGLRLRPVLLDSGWP